jgi:hypothetical protein
VTERVVSAYVLAADPTWIRTSISLYYPYVSEIVVSFDQTGRGWTGAKIPIEDCMAALREIDIDGKIKLLPGDYFQPGLDPLISETRQRQEAIDACSGDWILQLDPDEVLPNFGSLASALEDAERLGCSAVEWPMRVLYRRLRSGRYLVVCCRDGSMHTEFPGAVAVRRATRLTQCRRTGEPTLRLCVTQASQSIQLRRSPAVNETRQASLTEDDVIWHNSWARRPGIIHRKIGSWGHASGVSGNGYFLRTWYPAPFTWKLLRNFHPFSQDLWQRLEPIARLPFGVHPYDEF